MSDTTVDRVAQQTEEITRDVLERASPLMIESAVNAAFERYQEKLETELAGARTAVTSVMDDFATKTLVNERIKEFGEGAKKELKEGLDSALLDLNRENARRQDVFDQQVKKILELAQAAETRSIENEKAIASIQAANEQRFVQIEKQIAVIRRDIDDNVKTVSDAARRMDATFAKFIDKSEKRIERIEQNASTVARDVVQAGKRIDDLQEQRNEDVKEVRRIEGIANTNDNVVRDLDNRVSLGMTNIQEALYGNKEKKKRSLIDDVATLQQGLNWLTFFGTRRGMLVLGALYVSFLIVTAFILGRPEIVAAMIPTGSVKPN